MTDSDILTRLEELEIRQAFCDDLVENLNLTVARQQQEIQQIQLQLKQLLEQMLKTYENALLDKILEAPCLKEMIETDAFVHQYKFILLEQLNKKDHKLL